MLFIPAFSSWSNIIEGAFSILRSNDRFTRRVAEALSPFVYRDTFGLSCASTSPSGKRLT
jgi:hypothetical protein